MKKLSVLLAAFLLAHPAFPQFNPPSSGPYRSLVQSAGTDAICALHADTIAGLTCNNAVTDGTTETAFKSGVVIPAGALSRNTISVSSQLLIRAAGATPAVTFRLRLGGIGGTLIFQGNSNGFGASAAAAQAVRCDISALAASSSTTPVIVSCNQVAMASTSLLSNTLITGSTTSVSVDNTVARTLVWTLQFSTNGAGTGIGLYTMFNGIR